MNLDLLRRPQATIPELVRREPREWTVPLAGYFFVSFAEGYDRAITQWAYLPGFVLVVIVAIAALAIGMWAWAGIFGGALYLSARLLKGKPGFYDSVMAIGYGFFWPGVAAFFSAVLVILGGFRGDAMPTASMIGLSVQILAGVWALYTVIAAIKSHHEFGWWKAIATYLLPFILLISAVFAYVAVVGLP